MNRTARSWILTGIALLAICALLFWARGSHGRNAVERYKAELRAKGEKLTWTELGFPRAPETNDSLPRLLTAVTTLGSMRFDPGDLEIMHYAGPALVRPCGSAGAPRLKANSGATNSLTWQRFDAELESLTNTLMEIRQAVRNPPNYFYVDPANFTNRPTGPLPSIRTAALWLKADAIGALHVGQLGRTRENIHALSRLAQFHKEDMTLASQMIRAAVAGLGLDLTWEALQVKGRPEQDLALFQKDWEGFDLVAGLETGLLGARASGEEAISWLRRSRDNTLENLFTRSAGTAPAQAPLEDRLRAWGLTTLWRANAQADELFLLQHYQQDLDIVRQLRKHAPLAKSRQAWQSAQDALEAKSANRFFAIRYSVSLISIPNMARAAYRVVRTETQRQLTIAAIALERFRLRQGRLPADLSALAPDWLSAVPLDPMSGKPLQYRLKPDGTFLLYSVGEDGRDDGGDPNPSSATNKFDLWSGRDAVWPRAAGD